MKPDFDDCFWYPDTDELTGRRVWVAGCFGAIDADMYSWAQTCVDTLDVQHCPFCGQYLCDTTKSELEAERRADEEYRYGVANGLYGYGG